MTRRRLRKLYEEVNADDVLRFIDPLIEALAAKRPSTAAVAQIGCWLASTSPDRGPVKIGIALLGITGAPDSELLHDLGAHEEFTLFAAVAFLQVYGFNRLLYIGLSPALAGVHRVKVAVYQFAYAALLSLVVILSVRVVGVLLVTALLIVPAATARNLARSAGGMLWWALGIGMISAVAGRVRGSSGMCRW